LEHAQEEQAHADALAERIVQLGGEPNFSPDGLQHRSHSEYTEGRSLEDMIRENLVAERIAIDSYRQMIEYIGGDDPTTDGCSKRLRPRKKSMPRTSPVCWTRPECRAAPGSGRTENPT
jgi:bacterioferritin (cytochrome b1)